MSDLSSLTISDIAARAAAIGQNIAALQSQLDTVQAETAGYLEELKALVEELKSRPGTAAFAAQLDELLAQCGPLQ